MPNSKQPAGTHRNGVGPRPFAQYQITLDRPEGDPAEIGLTIRKPQEKGPDKWATSRTPDSAHDAHKQAVDELVKLYRELTAGSVDIEHVVAPEPEVVVATDADGEITAIGEFLNEDVNETAQDGSCSRATAKGTPCKSKAGAATEHLGTGACKSHEGQPLLVLESV